MPQLDIGIWFNQASVAIVCFLFLAFCFLLVYVSQNVSILKLKKKLEVLRASNTEYYNAQISSRDSSALVQFDTIVQTLLVEKTILESSAKDKEDSISLNALIQEAQHSPAFFSHVKTWKSYHLDDLALADEEKASD